MLPLLDLFFPKRCLGCGRWGTYVCPSCFKHIPPLAILSCPICGKPAIEGRTHPRCQQRYGLDGIYSFFPYTGIVKECIKATKYRFAYTTVLDLFSHVSQHSFDVARNVILSNGSAVCIPIPLHKMRKRWRGFNQAEVFARIFAEATHCQVDTSVLMRSRYTIPQVEMHDRIERFTNMKNVFVVDKVAMYALRAQSVLLVDDVYTTGATLRSAATVLKHAGVKSVWAVTIAR